jgi:hypothetical protein
MNIEDLLTPVQAAEAIGATSKRAVYRAIARAKAAGEDVTVAPFGTMLVRKDKLAVLKNYYFPYYSEAHQANVKKWGAAGGAAAGVTKRKRKEQGG